MIRGYPYFWTHPPKILGKIYHYSGKKNFSAQWQQRVVLHRSGLWNKDPGLVANATMLEKSCLFLPEWWKLVLPHNVRYAKYSYRILWENCVRDSETKISKCFAEIWVSSWLKRKNPVRPDWHGDDTQNPQRPSYTNWCTTMNDKSYNLAAPLFTEVLHWNGW